MPSSDDELPEELEDTAARVKATLHAAAREMPATTPDDERVPARSQWPARAAWIAAAVVAVVLVGVLVVVGRAGEGGGPDVVTGPPSDRSLPDLGVPDDLVIDAGRVRAKLGREDGKFDGALGFDTTADPTTIVVTVPDPDAARSALEAEVSDPSRLRVQATALAQHERINLMEQLDPVVGQHGNVLLGDHVVEAELFPFEEELAAQLVRDHGTAVRVTVAGFAFPYHDEDRCPAIPPPPPPGVDVTLDVQTATVSHDSNGLAVATVTNSTSEPFEVQRPQAGPGVWWGALVHPGTLDIVGWHTEPALYTAELKSSTAIDPGASLQVGVDIGRVACSVSSTTGTRIPTADYELVGFVTLPAGAAVRTSAVPVRVAAEPPSAAEVAGGGPDRDAVAPTPEQLALVERFRQFAADPTPANWEAVGVGRGIELTFGGVFGAPRETFADPARWRFPAEGGERDVLALVRGLTEVEMTQGPPRWCGGALQAVDRDRLRRPPVASVTFETAAPSSCDDWVAVTLNTDADGLLVGVDVYTWTP